MLWRRISEEDVKTVVGSPDNVQETIKNRKNAIKTMGPRLLKVTYTEEQERIVVMSQAQS
jgi:hypothetical protein